MHMAARFFVDERCWTIGEEKEENKIETGRRERRYLEGRTALEKGWMNEDVWKERSLRNRNRNW